MRGKMAARKSRHTNIILAALAVVNILPLVAMMFLPDGAKEKIFYVYWAEAALAAMFSLVFFGKRLLVFFVVLLVAAWISSLNENPPIVEVNVSLTFWALYSLCWMVYIEMSHNTFGMQMKRLNPRQQILLYSVFTGAAIALCCALTAAIHDLWGLFRLTPPETYAVFLSAAIAIPTLSIAIIRIVDMIGPRHFLLFMLGTYHRPVELDRIVLFLDMVGSSAVAERLKPKQSMSLVAQFIFDATAVFRQYGGDTINYTGDGVVVLWPRRQADRVLAAVNALRQRLDDNSGVYYKEFGTVPDFRVGIHAGKTVISQVGEEKLFLGVYGDTVNMAARLEQMNKTLGTKVLLSESLLPNLSQNAKAVLHPMGMQTVRGRDEPVKVFTVRQAAS